MSTEKIKLSPSGWPFTSSVCISLAKAPLWPLWSRPARRAEAAAAKAGQSQSKWVKPILWVTSAARIACKSMIINSLQHKQL